MREETRKPDYLKGDNPFRVPEGYMEGLVSRIMSQLPEKSLNEASRKVAIMDYVRPWLYLAAVFAGLGLFVNLLVGKSDSDNIVVADSLRIQNNIYQEAFSSIRAEEDDEYLEYIESHYVDHIFAEERADFE
ncbi:MAG: hypothetical protein LBJ39_03490 [Tannerellaceae bacterium]|jgi:hypothetical protein|nr:hypothetical protein [Tannerellaceae bacterium]